MVTSLVGMHVFAILRNVLVKFEHAKNDRSTNELPPLHDPFNNFNLAYDATQKSNVLNKYVCSITKLNDDDAVRLFL
jgi:hypothetical protein